MVSPGCCLPLLAGDLVSLLQTVVNTGGSTVTGGGAAGGVAGGVAGAGAGLATGGAGFGTAGTAGSGLLSGGSTLSALLSSTLLPGLGLGLLKGLFLAELLRPQKKGKSYGYEGSHSYKQRLGLDYPQYPGYPHYVTPHSSDGKHYDGSF